MFIEYKVKFGQDGITVTQCIDIDAVTIGEDEVRGDQQAAELETGHANVAKENRLSRAAPLQSVAAAPVEGAGQGDNTRGAGQGDNTRGAGQGNNTRGAGQGDNTRGSGRVIVLGPIIINCPPPPK